MTAHSKVIAYTAGEPAGIGLDIIIHAVQQQILKDVVCITCQQSLQQRARLLGLPLTIYSYPDLPTNRQSVCVLDVPVKHKVIVGNPNVGNVPAVLSMLDIAVDGCISGQFSAMVTGPLHKGVVNDAGFLFSGHTEYLAERTSTALPVMMLVSSKMRVALVTTHLPLKEVSTAVTEQRVIDVCTIIYNDLRTKFAIEKPKLSICGLNPHAGEGGHLGREEVDIIIPALDQLRVDGINVKGPFPADTVFTKKHLSESDVIIAMYHDQGLPTLKSQSFGKAANITLGLPIIRTSVDHGTAFDLAGSGNVDIGSLQTALSVTRETVACQ